MKRFLKALLALLGVAFVVLVLLLLWPLPDAPRNGVAGDFLIQDVDIVDVRNGMLREAQDVLVVDGTIDTIAPAGTIALPAFVTVVSGDGRFLLPGLWDMHTHSPKLAGQYYHPLLIANGVTGAREMWGCMSEPEGFIACSDDLERWNAALDAGTGVSPRFVQLSSFQINGGNEVPEGFPEFFKARNAEEAEALVGFYADRRVDFLKIYSELSVDAYQTLAAAARARGLKLAGHRPFAVSLEQMLAAGQVSVEHPRLFLFECYADAAAFRALDDHLGAYDHAFRQDMVERHDAARCEELMRLMASSDTWWVPTMQVLRMSAMAGDAGFRADPRLKYVPVLIREGMWMPDADRAAALTAANPYEDVYGAMYRLAQEHVRRAHEAGVRILAGTDAGDTYVFPGFGIHDELAALVAAGMPPAAALRSATLDAAVFVGLEDRYGTIEVGKAADMLLIDGNPLQDIRATQAIEGLLFNGRYYDRAALDELLDFAEKRARSLRTNLHLVWAILNSPIVRVQLAD